jgi:hypothetical protein
MSDAIEEVDEFRDPDLISNLSAVVTHQGWASKRLLD